jgi:GNAT superfamily N-acetyltransferase
MTGENLERMIRLAEEFFATKNDLAQISVDGDTIERLQKIHPATMSEKNDGKGPVAWVLVIPTMREVMEKFIAGEITERDLLMNTPLGGSYNAIYLCSALVLPEHRGRGLARGLVSKAIRSIQREHPIECLFIWAFSEGGEKLATSISREFSLPLYKRVI